MNQTGNELGAVREVLQYFLRWYRAYEGEILDDQDPDQRGRVKVSLPELGWVLPDECPWCYPEYRFGQVTPAVGTTVTVRFRGALQHKPVYGPRTGVAKANKPPAYESPNTAVLFQDDGEDPLTVTWQRTEKILTVKSAEYEQVLDMAKSKLDIKLGGKFTANISDAGLKIALDQFVLDTNGSNALSLKLGSVKMEMDATKVTVNGNLEVLL